MLAHERALGVGPLEHDVLAAVVGELHRLAGGVGEREVGRGAGRATRRAPRQRSRRAASGERAQAGNWAGHRKTSYTGNTSALKARRAPRRRRPSLRTSGSSNGSLPGPVQHVDRHAVAAQRGERLRDRRVAPRPVGAHQRDVAFRANAPRTSAAFSTSRLFTWQVTHHAAVKSTNTGRPARRRARDTVAGVNATAIALGARGRRPSRGLRPTRSRRAANSGHATTADDRERDERRDAPRARAAGAHDPPCPERERRRRRSASIRRSTASLSTLRAEHPREPDHRRVQRERQHLLEALHPRAGPRQPPPPSREPRRAARTAAPCPTPSATKIASIVVAGSGQREAERRAHERRRARRRDDDGENAGAERIERADSSTSSRVTPDGASWPNSNTPDRLSASTKNRIGERASRPPATAAEIPSRAARPRRAARAARTPARRTSARRRPRTRGLAARIVARVSLCVAKPSTFSDSTGNTHGMRLRISPPTSAETTAMRRA